MGCNQKCVFLLKLLAYGINKTIDQGERLSYDHLWCNKYCHLAELCVNCTIVSNDINAPVLFICIVNASHLDIRFDMTAETKSISWKVSINISFFFLHLAFIDIYSGCSLRFWRWLLFVIVTMRVEITVKRDGGSCSYII